ncbi:unnamed protein product [Symbiodinium sp. CCMP2592]|nr:unnamed protein product [Symbiodinium sp. CCMP2592]
MSPPSLQTTEKGLEHYEAYLRRQGQSQVRGMEAISQSLEDAPRTQERRGTDDTEMPRGETTRALQRRSPQLASALMPAQSTLIRFRRRLRSLSFRRSVLRGELPSPTWRRKQKSARLADPSWTRQTWQHPGSKLSAGARGMVAILLTGECWVRETNNVAIEHFLQFGDLAIFAMTTTPAHTFGALAGPMQLDPASPGASTAATGSGGDHRDLLDITSPKRGRTEAGQGVTLEAIRDLLRGELSMAVGQMNERVGTFEQNVQAQLADTTMRIHNMSLETEANKDKISQVQDRMESLETRLAKLEQGDTANPEGTRPRGPALIMGGFHPDTEAEKVIEQAKKYVETLRLDLDTQGTFVPGVRRGYCIIPLIKRDTESEEDQRARVQSCIRHIRNANISVGTRQDGTPSHLWLNISQPPEKRRKVQVAAKCKRLLLELGALPQDIDTEYSTGQVWFKSVRVASAINLGAPSQSTTTGTQGWIDLPTISAKIHVDVGRVKTHWQQLASALK